MSRHSVTKRRSRASRRRRRAWLEQTTVPAIRVRHLWHRFGTLDVLRDVTFDVGHGEIFGFIGPNGAGKTTTIRVMATLLEPMAGRVEVDGLDVTIDPEAVRKIIGYMPDHAGVYERVTVREYLEFFADAYKVAPRRDLRRRRRGHRAHRSDEAPRQARRDDVEGHEAAPAARAHAAPRSEGAHPRRARERSRSARAHRDPRSARRAARRWARRSSSRRHILTELADVCTSVAILERGRLVVAGPIGDIARRLESRARSASSSGARARPARSAAAADADAAEPLQQPHDAPRHADGDRRRSAGRDARSSRAADDQRARRRLKVRALGSSTRCRRARRRAERLRRHAGRRRARRSSTYVGRRSGRSPTIVRALVADEHRRSSASSPSATSSSGSSSRSRRERCNDAPRALAADCRSPQRRRRARLLRADRSREPNAIWMREMRQSARLGRTPWILFALTPDDLAAHVLDRRHRRGRQREPRAARRRALPGLLLDRRTSSSRSSGPPSPRTASPPSARGERGRRCSSPGLTPKDIARGKFLAAYTTIAHATSSCSRRSARCPFLFGGVTAIEVVVAFAFLFLVAALAVAFGLAVSSLMSSLRGAIVVTLMLAILHRARSSTSSSASARRSRSTSSGATSPRASRSGSRSPTRARRSASSTCSSSSLLPLLLDRRARVVPLRGDDREPHRRDRRSLDRPQALVLRVHAARRARVRAPGRRSRSTTRSACGWSVTGDDVLRRVRRVLRAPLRVRAGRTRRAACSSTGGATSAGVFRRFFGPGLPKTASLVVLMGFVGLLAIAAIDVAMLYIQPAVSPTASTGWSYWSPYTPTRNDRLAQIFVFGAYCAPFFVFTAGLTA